jgi:hypothetical protein
MNPQVIHALLSDSSGSVLVVRRRGAVLLGLPGGDVRRPDALEALLSIYCARQVGVEPDFAGGLVEFTLAQRRVAVGFAEILHARAGARGRVDAALWVRADRLPTELDPIARYAIALFVQRRAANASPGAEWARLFRVA